MVKGLGSSGLGFRDLRYSFWQFRVLGFRGYGLGTLRAYWEYMGIRQNLPDEVNFSGTLLAYQTDHYVHSYWSIGTPNIDSSSGSGLRATGSARA